MDFADLCSEAGSAPIGAEGLIFLPYLTGERTPHCDPEARGAFLGLTRMHQRAHLTRAVLEGICLGLADSLALIRASGTKVKEVTVTGGGTRSAVWMQILADVCNAKIILRSGADAGPALGAARLALIGACGVNPAKACSAGPIEKTYLAKAASVKAYASLAKRFAAAYPAVRALG
jgi:xylulokinase